MKAVQTMTGQSATVPPSAFDVQRVREDFPILHQQIKGKPLAYLDNAATAQKPQCVIDAVRNYYEHDNANVHRGVHALSERATNAFENARATLARYLGAAGPEEVVFVRGATEAINLVAQSFVRPNLRAGDEILVTEMEHHSNIVPWQMLCEQSGAVLRVLPIDDNGELVLHEYEKLLSDRTKIVGVVHASNALGTINPIKEMIATAHARNIPVLIDGAQAVPHFKVDVRDLDCDFYAVSAHKMFGPTGIGALYGRRELLDAMPPYQGGGDMIKSVSFSGTIYNDVPARFEAGTPNIAGAVGFAAAADYLSSLGYDAIAAHEDALLEYGTAVLSAIPEVRLVGTARKKVGVISFVVEGIHPHDLGSVLDGRGVAVRTGHHCAQPVMERFRVTATVRASLAFYNTTAELDALAAGVREAIEFFG